MEDVKLQDKIREFLSIDIGSGYGVLCGYWYWPRDGAGYGDGIGQINGMHIYRIDDVPTIITSVKGNIAKGFIFQADLTLTPCYVVKGNGFFAHGGNLRQAMDALTDKMFDHMPEEERIGEFVKAHPEYRRPYSNTDLFEWHHRLTGSCMAGRNAFVKDRGLTLEGETTVEEFVILTKNAYGGQTIRKLPGRYKERG